ncbi:MAG: hypothetical protein E7255_05590 [Lachnospiraceae bacterium]|jgi:ABC-type transport system involved in multi-copper enzyme maturation permease subunit|nr:hypothetical protein [Lachnospiraceae bacterium]
MKTNFQRILKKFLLVLLFGFCYLGIGYAAGLLISRQFNCRIEDVMTYEGILLTFLGILSSMRGNPSGMNINGIGQDNANMISYLSNEVTRQERERNPYNKDFHRNNIVSFVFGGLTLIVGGLLLLGVVIVFIK